MCRPFIGPAVLNLDGGSRRNAGIKELSPERRRRLDKVGFFWMYRAWGRLLTDRQDRARTYHVLRGNNSGSLAMFAAILRAVLMSDYLRLYKQQSRRLMSENRRPCLPHTRLFARAVEKCIVGY